MRRILIALAALAFLSLPVCAQTTITGTFLTNSGQTPEAANLSVLQTVNGTNVCGQLDFVPYNVSARGPWAILWDGTTYAPQNVRGYIRCSDGVLINSSGAAGISVIPTEDAQPSGTLEWMHGGMDGSADGTVRPVSWSEAKAIPDQSTIDWGILPVASIVDVGYQTIENAGTPLTVRTVLNFTAGGCVDNSSANRTDCSGNGSGSIDVNGNPISTPNLNSTSPTADANFLAATFKVSSSSVIVEVPTFGASGSSHSMGLVPDPGATSGTTRFLREDSTWDVPPVTSVFGRTGAITSQSGDYSFSQISGTLGSTQCPDPSASSIGCVESFASVSHEWINAISTSGVPSASQPSCADLSNGAASCSTDTTNASNISSGTLPAARLPNPSVSTLGGIESFAAQSHEWINAISTSGAPSASQPNFSDLLGTVSSAQFGSQTQNTFLAAPNGSNGNPTFRAIVAADIPTLNQSTTGNAATATNLSSYPALCTGSQFSQGLSSGSNNCATPSGSGNTTSTSLTNNYLPKANGANSIVNSSVQDNGTTVSTTEPFQANGITSTSDGVHNGIVAPVGNTTQNINQNANTAGFTGPNSASFTCWNFQLPSAYPTSAGVFLAAAGVAVPSSTNGCYSSQASVGLVAAADMNAQYSKGSCTEIWGGTNTGNALQSGDDAVANNGCYNDSGVTRTITAVKCRNDNASNTSTVNPTFGSAGTGTTILSAALTCGSSYAYSSSGTVTNASWTTGTGIDPAMGGTLTGTSIAMIVEYTF